MRGFTTLGFELGFRGSFQADVVSLSKTSKTGKLVDWSAIQTWVSDRIAIEESCSRSAGC